MVKLVDTQDLKSCSR